MMTETMKSLGRAAGKWTMVYLWFDLIDRVWGSTVDAFLAQYPSLAWLDGFTKCIH